MLSLLGVGMRGVRLLIGLTRSVLSFFDGDAALLLWIGSNVDTHQYTENSASQPQVTILEARDICGGATGRNGMFLIYTRTASDLKI
jgi:hypothetical protein